MLAVRPGAGEVRQGVVVLRSELVEAACSAARSRRRPVPSSSRSGERSVGTGAAGAVDGGGPPVAIAVGASRARRRKPPRVGLFWRWASALLLVAVAGGVVVAAGAVMERGLAGASPLRPKLHACSSYQLNEDGCGQLYVVRPGDTIWSVALRYDRGGDPRPLVDQLEGEVGGGALQPGEELVVP
ncbi:MAG: LysM peptidoglycan-binding domain-containing protein [Acidimicrobiales bacterium]